MEMQLADSIFTLSFDSVGTMTLGAILLLIGYWIKSKVYFLEKFCIPAPVIGGFLFVFLNCLFFMSGRINLVFDAFLQTGLFHNCRPRGQPEGSFNRRQAFIYLLVCKCTDHCPPDWYRCVSWTGSWT